MPNPEPSRQLVYKLCPAATWRAACEQAFYTGSADDVRDGFIHLSTKVQLAGTARRYFAGEQGLVLVALDVARLGPSLRWEPSRGGQLYPHLYAPLDVEAAVSVIALSLGPDGVPLLPTGSTGP